MNGVWLDLDNLRNKKEKVITFRGMQYVITLKSLQDADKPCNPEERKKILRNRLKTTQEKYNNFPLKYTDPFGPAISISEWDALK